MTALEYIARVSQRLEQEARGRTFPPSTIMSTLKGALNQLGRRVAQDPDPAKRARLQKSFSLTLSSGESALDATMVDLALTLADWRLSGVSRALQLVPTIEDLLTPPPLSDFHFYTLAEGKVKVRTHLGAVPATTAVTVIANYYPTISEVPNDLADKDLIDIGVEICLEGQPKQEGQEV